LVGALTKQGQVKIKKENTLNVQDKKEGNALGGGGNGGGTGRPWKEEV